MSLTADQISAARAAPGSAGRGVGALQAFARAALAPLAAFWMFSGGFVLVEPSPYELVFLIVAPLAILAGIGLHRQPQLLLYLLIVFTPFAMIGAFQVKHMTTLKGVVYVLVTMFLWLTSYLIANYVADAPFKRLKNLMNGYTAIAVIVSLLGSLAYLGLIPGGEILTKFDRAKGTFEDPNVFGPFLILPAMFAVQKLFMGGKNSFLIPAAIFGILSAGVFFSFSRAAWGHLLFSTLFVFVMVYLYEAGPRERSRMGFLLMIGGILGVIGLAIALSIDNVRDLFLQRFSLVQSYDSGETGRFGRQAFAFELALAHPFGIGPLEFENTHITEEPHNTYVKVFLTYGWIGGFCYVALVWATLKRGWAALMRPSPYRPLLIPVMSVFIALVLESAIIDSDHWRHYFLVVGLVWGIVAAYDRDPHQERHIRF